MMTIATVPAIAAFRSEDCWAMWAYTRPDGTAWTCAGSSKALFRVPDNYSGCEPLEYNFADRSGEYPRRPSGAAIDAIFDQVKNGELIEATVADWLAIEGPPFVRGEPKTVRCKECNGTGTGECFHCNQSTDCEECDGTGKVTKEPDGPPLRGVCVAKVWFDVRLVCDLLRCVVPGPMTMRIPSSGKPALFTGDGWELVVMPLTNGDGAAEKLHWKKRPPDHRPTHPRTA